MKCLTRWMVLIFLLLSPCSVFAGVNTFATTKGNIYSAGGDIDVTKDVTGDAVVAAGNIVISGNIGADILAAAGTIRISGSVGDDLRIAGGEVSVKSAVGGEAAIAGGDLKLLPGTDVSEDLMIAGGNIRIQGKVRGESMVYGSEVLADGVFQKDLRVSAGKLTVSKNTIINGNLIYEGPEEAHIEEGAVIKGEKIFTLREREPGKRFAGLLAAWWVIKLLAVMAAASLIYGALKRKTGEFVSIALHRFGRETLIGFLVLIATPVLVFFLFITVIGWVLGLTTTFFYLAMISLSTVFGAIAFSGLMGKYLLKKQQILTWPILLGGVLLYEIVGAVPLLGWLFKFVFFLTALGTLSQIIYENIRESPAQPARPTNSSLY